MNSNEFQAALAAVQARVERDFERQGGPTFRRQVPRDAAHPRARQARTATQSTPRRCRLTPSPRLARLLFCASQVNNTCRSGGSGAHRRDRLRHGTFTAGTCAPGTACASAWRVTMFDVLCRGGAPCGTVREIDARRQRDALCPRTRRRHDRDVRQHVGAAEEGRDQPRIDPSDLETFRGARAEERGRRARKRAGVEGRVPAEEHSGSCRGALWARRGEEHAGGARGPAPLTRRSPSTPRPWPRASNISRAPRARAPRGGPRVCRPLRRHVRRGHVGVDRP